MVQKKVCMLGAFAVGKTSLVRRFVDSVFSDGYLTTVGVKIDKKEVFVDDRQLTLVLWDLAGEDEFQRVQMSYLRGAAGYLLVVDGTRRTTLDKVLILKQRAAEATGEVPFVVLLNKSDLDGEWAIDDDAIAELNRRGWPVFRTSAKTGLGTEEAFLHLARLMSDSP